MELSGRGTCSDSPVPDIASALRLVDLAGAVAFFGFLGAGVFLVAAALFLGGAFAVAFAFAVSFAGAPFLAGGASFLAGVSFLTDSFATFADSSFFQGPLF